MRKKYRFYIVSVFLCTIMSAGLPQIHAVNQNQNSVYFLIDVSGSMKGEKINGVKTAIKAIITALPASVDAGVIIFSRKATVLVSLTTNRQLLLFAVSNLQANGETALFDAVMLGLEKSPQTTRSRIILLTDGEDTVSKESASNLLTALALRGIPVDSIGLQTTSQQDRTLQAISDSSSGVFYPLSEVDKLIEVYQKSLTTILKPTFKEPPTTTLIEYKGTNWRLIPYLISLSMFVLTFLFLVLLRKILRDKRYRQAQWRALETHNIQKVSNQPFAKIRKNIDFEALPPRFKHWINSRLEIIHSEASFERVVKFLCILFFIIFFVGWLIFSNVFVAIIMAIFLTPFLFAKYVKKRHQKQIRLFAEELPDLLNIVASALRSGLTLQQGLEAFSLENKGEVARQIRRASSEIQMGTTVEDALMSIAVRMNNEDLKWTVTALSIQKNVGGSLATILGTTYTTVKERAELRREVRTLSAEGKLSAYILMALPIGIFSFLFVTKREYVSIFWTEPVGFLLLVVIASALSIGWLWIKKIIEIKI